MNGAANRFGFRDGRDHKIFLENRDAMKESRVQGFLAKAYRVSRQLDCLCCSSHPRVFIYFERATDNYWIQRDHIETHHAPGCPALVAYRAGQSRGSVVRYSPSILDLAPSKKNHRSLDSLASSKTVASAAYEDFSHLCNTAFSWAVFGAFQEANEGKRSVNQAPDKAAFLEAFGCELGRQKFTDGRSAFEIVASLGRKISYGFTYRALVQSLTGRTLPPQHYRRFIFSATGDSRGGNIHEVWLDQLIAEQLSGRTTTYLRTIEPPYFFVLVHGDRSVSRAARLYVQPIAEAAGRTCPIDSELEREIALWLFAQGRPFSKPKHSREFELIPGLDFTDLDQTRYLPDFVVPGRAAILLLEGVGGTSPNYARRLKNKIAYYKTLASRGVKYLLIERRHYGGRLQLGFVDLEISGVKVPFAPLEHWPLERILPRCGLGDA